MDEGGVYASCGAGQWLARMMCRRAWTGGGGIGCWGGVLGRRQRRVGDETPALEACASAGVLVLGWRVGRQDTRGHAPACTGVLAFFPRV